MGEDMSHVKISILVANIEQISVVIFGWGLARPYAHLLAVEDTSDNATMAVAGKTGSP
jgi:hypothetical protein